MDSGRKKKEMTDERLSETESKRQNKETMITVKPYSLKLVMGEWTPW